MRHTVLIPCEIRFLWMNDIFTIFNHRAWFVRCARETLLHDVYTYYTVHIHLENEYNSFCKITYNAFRITAKTVTANPSLHLRNGFSCQIHKSGNRSKYGIQSGLKCASFVRASSTFASSWILAQITVEGLMNFFWIKKWSAFSENPTRGI